VEPEENTLSLLYRDKDSLKFVKYVNTRVTDIENFHDAAYQEITDIRSDQLLWVILN
jgi:hypothetical protein